jgi:hypothetical protein
MSNQILPQLQGKTRNIVFGVIALVVAAPLWYFFFSLRDLVSLILALVLSLTGVFMLYRAFGAE